MWHSGTQLTPFFFRNCWQEICPACIDTDGVLSNSLPSGKTKGWLTKEYSPFVCSILHNNPFLMCLLVLVCLRSILCHLFFLRVTYCICYSCLPGLMWRTRCMSPRQNIQSSQTDGEMPSQRLWIHITCSNRQKLVHPQHAVVPSIFSPESRTTQVAVNISRTREPRLLTQSGMYAGATQVAVNIKGVSGYGWKFLECHIGYFMRYRKRCSDTNKKTNYITCLETARRIY
jgi:hypothetical protein